MYPNRDFARSAFGPRLRNPDCEVNWQSRRVRPDEPTLAAIRAKARELGAHVAVVAEPRGDMFDIEFRTPPSRAANGVSRIRVMLPRPTLASKLVEFIKDKRKEKP